jgi:glycosyltransferase involved in cell wall biosynthesis
MKNAVSPAFADLVPPEPWFRRGEPPLLVYTSQPYRGLNVLLDAFGFIRASIPGARLKVFSGLAATYRTALEEDPYRVLYHRCMTTEGVEYAGPIAQTALARELTAAAALAYPSTFGETSCIAALEAMAAGLIVITTRIAALPETTAGFARLVEYQDDHKRLAQDFAAATVAALTEARNDPDAASVKRKAEIAYVREHYTWPKRALEWEAWLAQIVRAQTV